MVFRIIQVASNWVRSELTGFTQEQLREMVGTAYKSFVFVQILTGLVVLSLGGLFTASLLYFFHSQVVTGQEILVISFVSLIVLTAASGALYNIYGDLYRDKEKKTFDDNLGEELEQMFIKLWNSNQKVQTKDIQSLQNQMDRLRESVLLLATSMQDEPTVKKEDHLSILNNKQSSKF